jgi:hypothetical protein
MSGTAIEHFRPVRLPALMELLGADVACTLRLSNSRKRRGTGSKCELMLANKTQVTVSGRLYGIDRKRRTRDFGMLTVIANGMGSSVFTLPAGAETCERVYLEVVGEGVRLSADARIAPDHPSFAVPILAASASMVLVAAIAAAAIYTERPLIRAFVVPRSVTPGIVMATYATTGLSNGTYAATAWDGTQLAAGDLPAPTGELPIVVPPKIAGQSVRVSLDLNGPLGHAQREVSFAVVGAPPVVAPLAAAVLPLPVSAAHAHIPRIAYFTAHRERYGGQVSVLASYQASGESGLLRIRDEHGKLLGMRDFSHVGTTRIPLAVDPGNQALRAEIEVAGAGARSSAAVEIPSEAVVAVAAAIATAPETPANAADDGGSVPTSSDPFFVAQRVVAGREFTIDIRYPLPEMRIGLQTTIGTTVDEVAVPPNAHKVTLRAPATSSFQIYYLAGTFTRSSAEETLVRSLRIFPD